MMTAIWAMLAWALGILAVVLVLGLALLLMACVVAASIAGFKGATAPRNERRIGRHG